MENLPQFNIVDIAVLALIVLGLIRGLARGLSGELATLVSTVAALAAGWFGYKPIGNYLLENTRLAGPVAYAVAFVLALIAVYIGMLLLRFILRSLMEFTFKGGLEKIGGGLAGMIRAAVFCAIVILLLGWLPHAYIHRLFADQSFFGRLVFRFGAPAYEELSEKYPALKVAAPGTATNEVREAKPEKKERKRKKTRGE